MIDKRPIILKRVFSFFLNSKFLFSMFNQIRLTNRSVNQYNLYFLEVARLQFFSENAKNSDVRANHYVRNCLLMMNTNRFILKRADNLFSSFVTTVSATFLHDLPHLKKYDVHLKNCDKYYFLP